MSHCIEVDAEKTFYRDLPEAPGVYLFYQTPHSLPLYIGKSIQLKKRIQAHFQRAKTNRKEKRLMSQVALIEYRLTVGEIGALLLESQLIKAKLPRHNRRLRKTKLLYTIQLESMGDSLVPSVIEHRSTSFTPNQRHYGLFRTRRSATDFLENLVATHQLCKKILKLEQTQRACFSHQLNKCRGACVAAESIVEHNQRLEQALQAHRQLTWPYSGPIAIKESNATQTEYHVLDQWAYLGTVSHETELQPCLADKNSSQFDIDTFHILLQALDRLGSLEVIMI